MKITSQNYKKLPFILCLALLIILSGIFIKRKFYDTRHTNTKAKEIVEKKEIENGDIIFQTSLSSQSKAIQLATNSEYSHCGIIFNENGWHVFEAVQPIKMTPLDEWIAKGKNGKYVVKRLIDAEKLKRTDSYSAFCKELNRFNGKNYDSFFGWSDDKIYCSELIWKGYKRGLGIELCRLQKLRDFDLTNPIVKKKLVERYGNKIPKDENVVSPIALFNSRLLKTIKSN